jgi:beta-lactamase class A
LLSRVIAAGVVFCATLPAQPALQRNIAEIAKDAQGKVAVACSLPATELNCDLDPHAHPPMQSVFKFPLALTVLHLVERGQVSLDEPVRFRAADRFAGTWSPLQDEYPNAEVDVTVRRLLGLSVSDSDNIATDLLLRRIGGPTVAESYIQSLGIAGIRLIDNEAALHRDDSAQYRNWMEPAAAVQLLRLVNDHPPITAEHAGLLLDWMGRGTRANGRIAGQLPAGTVVMHKPGTSGAVKGLSAATNDIGLVVLPDGRRLALAVFVTDSTADDATRDAVIARISKAVFDAAVGKSANEFALGLMNTRRVQAVTVMQDAGTGALVASVASHPSELDVSTQVLPLSLAKVFLAASWWDNRQANTLGSPTQSIHDMIARGSDSLGRTVALALRKAVESEKVLADLHRYGFNLTDNLNDTEWADVLSIGESHVTISALQVSRFMQAVGNQGMQWAEGRAQSRIMQADTARRLLAAMRDTVRVGSATRIAGILDGTGWAIGGKTGTGGRAGALMEQQDGWFAGVIFDATGKPRYTVATFVTQGGLGAGNAGEISAQLARFVIGNAR